MSEVGTIQGHGNKCHYTIGLYKCRVTSCKDSSTIGRPLVVTPGVILGAMIRSS